MYVETQIPLELIDYRPKATILLKFLFQFKS